MKQHIKTQTLRKWLYLFFIKSKLFVCYNWHQSVHRRSYQKAVVDTLVKLLTMVYKWIYNEWQQQGSKANGTTMMKRRPSDKCVEMKYIWF